MNILLEIKNKLDLLPKSEVKIANYILNNEEKIKNITSSQLASEVGVGQSTIIKFIKKFEVSGFTEFKILINEAILKKNIGRNKSHDNISLENSFEEIYSKLVNEHIKSIEDTFNEIKKDDIQQVVNVIDKSRRIVIIGIGNSAIVSKDFNNKLLKIGKVSLFNEDLHVTATSMVSMNENDICIIFTHSGKTEEILKLAELARKNKIKIITITSNSNSPIAKISDHVISAISDEGLFRTSAMSSRITQLLIVDILFLGIIKEDLDDRMNLIRKTRDIVGWSN